MIVIMHVMIALFSIVAATYSLTFASNKVLRLSSLLALATLGSGIYLVMMHPAQLVSACISGVMYLVVVGVIIGLARVRIASRLTA